MEDRLQPGEEAVQRTQGGFELLPATLGEHDRTEDEWNRLVAEDQAFPGQVVADLLKLRSALLWRAVEQLKKGLLGLSFTFEGLGPG